MTKVYLSGCGMSRFGKREESLPDLFVEAFSGTLEEVNNEGIEAVFVGSMNPEEFVDCGNISAVVADSLNLEVPSFRIETASSTGAAVFHAAALAVASGHYETVLAVAGEKMTHLPTPRVSRILSKVLSPDERRLGATMPALAAMVTRGYMHQFGLERETLALVAQKSHYNGSLNPYAHFQKEVSLEKILNSRLVSNPLRVYDCAPISDGAASAVLTSKSGHVRIAGLGHGSDMLSLQDRNSLSEFRATQRAARIAYDGARISPKDVDVAELHDAFTIFEIIDMEDMGFFPQGEGGEAVKQDKTTINGDLPINTSGGHKARGHPVGASGLAQIVEIYWQLKGEAQNRQVDGARIGLSQSIGGLANNNFVTILEACS
jgi:acetyl-CoA acetyltransferase